ncbi:hypothetical protein K1T71_011558 [Dendrolimus kikuchii]|uniref:Uncharacterized protein n=1 Tax=Dendrolimus kikuchii TaxID=765133 RepID=A0ACC1CPJ8_9NEOP|nr:hypothetical protein K1T71_011558 [Dendrolimus kikuchii]
MTPSRPNAPRGPVTLITLITRAVIIAVVATSALAKDTHDDILYDITDEQYYEMPALFGLEDYEACAGRRGVFCLGSFELEPEAPSSLFQMMQRYSANWVENFNHTRLHRGVCVSKSCDQFAPRGQRQPYDEHVIACPY